LNRSNTYLIRDAHILQKEGVKQCPFGESYLRNPNLSRKEADGMSKKNGVKNEMGGKENPSQTRSSTTVGKEATQSKQRGE
jgi:hypothetical protein